MLIIFKTTNISEGGWAMEETIKQLRRRLWSWWAVMFLAMALVLGALVNLIGYGLPIHSKAYAILAEAAQGFISALTNTLAPLKWWLGLSPQPTLAQGISVGNLLALVLIGLVLWSAYATFTIQRDLVRHRKNKQEAEDELAKENYKKQRRG